MTAFDVDYEDPDHAIFVAPSVMPLGVSSIAFFHSLTVRLRLFGLSSLMLPDLIVSLLTEPNFPGVPSAPSFASGRTPNSPQDFLISRTLLYFP